jgi:hypothetical protein
MSSAGQSGETIVTESEALQATQVAFLQKGDIDGMVEACYTADARMHGFTFRAEGHTEIKELVKLYLQRLSVLGERSIDKFATGPNYIWLEMTIQNPQGSPIKVYEVKFLRDGKIYLQLYGLREGTVWQPGDFSDFTAPDSAKARVFHQRYLDCHIHNDANGLADYFFTEDAQLITARVDVAGREPIRKIFQDLFAIETDFTPLSVQNITNDSDYVWFEATVTSSLGERRVYDMMLIRDGKVHLQLVGQLIGKLPTEVAFGDK